VSGPLRILHLIDKNRLTTGSVVQMLAAARGLAERGHHVEVGSRPGGELVSACGDAGLPFLSFGFRGPLDIGSARKLRHHLHHSRITILHAHKGRAHAAGLLAATGMGLYPRVVVNRGVTFELDHFNKWKFHHPRVGAVVCVADAVKDVVLRTTGANPELVHTIHGGSEPGYFDPTRVDGNRVRRELGLEPKHQLIGQVSVRGWKGWSDLIEAFATISGRFADARLVFVGCGSGDEISKVEEAAHSGGVSDRVLTLGFRHDMPEVLAACDLVVDASWEGTGITGTIREAMAMERPVVATDCGGNRELVVDGQVGLLVPPRDIGALANAMSRLIHDPALRQRLGRAARRRVVEHFTTERRIDKLEALYREILE
jgi:glycosyltransferase involved in cell wall biosynthesis